MIWEGDSVAGHYLDKGFNVKFIYRPQNQNIPNIAIGFDDFAGTGLLTKEYIVATRKVSNIETTIGLGWGKFTGEKTFKNPLSFLSDSLLKRPLKSNNYKSGGALSYDQWFRGEAILFGGFEYLIPKSNGLKVKVEYDPFNYFDFTANNRNDASEKIRRKESDINFGLSYPYNKYMLFDASYIKGNTISLSFTYSHTFNNRSSKKPKFNPKFDIKKNIDKSKPIFYENLLSNLNKNRLLLQTATLDKNNNLDISIATSEHRNGIRSASYASFVAKKVADDNDIKLSLIKISHINAGVELNNITFIANYLNKSNLQPIELKIRNTTLEAGNSNSFLKDEFKPDVIFPVIFSSTNPVIVSHIGNPERFYFGGLNIQNVSEVQFNRNLLLSTELNLRIFDNFRDSISGPASQMEHVRTDLVQYLKEDDFYIGRMQLDYIWSPYKDFYTKISGGLFETMFGGFGFEMLYKPFNKNFNVGVELFKVKQRSFNQRLSFSDYETVTGHVNFGYRFAAGIESNLSFGRYLAKDDGYTFDLGRTTKSGFKAGIYFTRTNVSAELFGEGSFDKGFYFQIPMDLFSNDYKGTYSSIKVSPLTRDGGAKLIFDKDLKGLIYNSSYYELSRQWNGFMN